MWKSQSLRRTRLNRRQPQAEYALALLLWRRRLADRDEADEGSRICLAWKSVRQGASGLTFVSRWGLLLDPLPARHSDDHRSGLARRHPVSSVWTGVRPA
jgi:hypothetical protein